MTIVGVGTKNPAKLQAVINVAEQHDWHAEGFDAPSGVSDQPIGDEETQRGAVSRAHAVLKLTDADFGIGLEGGVMECGQAMYVCNWGALIDQSGRVVTASGVRIPMPEPLVKGIKDGYELGEVIDVYASKHDVRSKEGTIGILTEGALSRTDVFQTIVTILFSQYKHLYK